MKHKVAMKESMETGLRGKKWGIKPRGMNMFQIV